MYTEVKRCNLTKDEIYSKIYRASQNGAYTSYLRGKRCKTEELFFFEVSASFQFPDYFGENWPAFDECLCDLEWLNISKILVIIDDFSQIFSDQKEIQNLLKERVIRYFSNMIEYWKTENVPVEVWLNN